MHLSLFLSLTLNLEGKWRLFRKCTAYVIAFVSSFPVLACVLYSPFLYTRLCGIVACGHSGTSLTPTHSVNNGTVGLGEWVKVCWI